MSEQTAVYRFYDADDRLLYVGVTKHFDKRRREHKATKKWWPLVKRPVIELYDDEQEALRVELDAIRTERPVYNVAITNGSYRARREVRPLGICMGTSEIRRALRISRQRVQQLVNRDDFPAPFDWLEMGKVWKREDVEAWARAHGREIADTTT